MASGSGVRGIIVAAGAFVLGVVVGGYGPRAEVRTLNDELFELRRGAARGSGVGGGEELARLITKGLDADEEEPAPADGAAAADGAPAPAEGEAGDGPPEGLPDDPLAAAREVLELRRTQARAALVEDADPASEQLDTVDRVVAEMNAQLESIARDFVAEVGQGREPSRRQLMTAGADVLDVLASTEDQMLRALTNEQRDAVREEATDPTSYIDPKVVEILAAIAPPEERR